MSSVLTLNNTTLTFHPKISSLILKLIQNHSWQGIITLSQITRYFQLMGAKITIPEFSLSGQDFVSLWLPDKEITNIKNILHGHNRQIFLLEVW
jgi:hypothetical protein